MDSLVKDVLTRAIGSIFKENASLRFKLKTFKEKREEVKKLKHKFESMLRNAILHMCSASVNFDMLLYMRNHDEIRRLLTKIQEDIVPDIQRHMFGEVYFYVQLTIKINVDFSIERDRYYNYLPKIYYSRKKNKWQVCNHIFEINENSIYCNKCNHIFKDYGEKDKHEN